MRPTPKRHLGHCGSRKITLFALLLACGCSDSDRPTAQKPGLAPTGNAGHHASQHAFSGTRLVSAPVLEVRRRKTAAIATVITESAEVVTTPEHPFAVAAGGWKPAGSLTVDDQVVTAQGTPARVLAVRVSTVPATSVYNLGVARTHSYFVGRQSLLVHNTCGAKPILPSEFLSAKSREPLQARRIAEYLRRHPKFGGLDTYTAGINLNGSLRKRYAGEPLTPYDKSKLKDADGATEVLRDAARSGHSFDGVVSRGIKHGIRGRIPDAELRRYFDLRPGDVWTTDTFLSMTADPDVAKKFGTDITMRIRQWSGVPIAEISNSPHEREVLLPPGTRFRVIARHEENGKLTLDLEELLEDEAGSSGSKRDEAAPSPDREIAQTDYLAKKIAGPAGSNAGGIYEGSDGVKRYVKFYADSAQAAGEHLANSIYRDLGLSGPKSTLFVHEGRLAYASEILPEVKTLGEKLTPELAKQALNGFPADVLVANWDVAGLTLDNMLVDAEGHIVRIDNGAAFLTRAQGARKPMAALGNVTEWETFFSAAKNPSYARLAAVAGVTGPADMAPVIQRGVAKILKVRDTAGGWRAYVEARSQGLSIADREQIIGMLETRTAFLERKVAELDAAATPVNPLRKRHDAASSTDHEREKQRQTGDREAELQARLEAARKELESIKNAGVGDMFTQFINDERAATLKKQIAEDERELAELRAQR